MSYDLEIWHVAWGTQALQSLYKWWPWVDLDLFYIKVKFAILGFSKDKGENIGFFRNYCRQWPQNWQMQTTNWVSEDMWVFKVKVISWSWSLAIIIWKLNFAFIRNHLGDFN